jgi:hypothetical protein
LPSPASVAVHVTGMLVVPEKVQTGSPPLLKCGLAALAGAAITVAKKAVAIKAVIITNIRRIIVPHSQAEH